MSRVECSRRLALSSFFMFATSGRWMVSGTALLTLALRAPSPLMTANSTGGVAPWRVVALRIGAVPPLASACIAWIAASQWVMNP